MSMISISKSFILHVLKVVSPLGKKFVYYSPLGSMIQKDYDSESSGFELHSFRDFQQYLTEKNPTHGGGTAAIFQYAIPKINMLCNLWCLKTRLRLLSNKYQKHSSLNLVSQQLKLCNIFIFGMAY